MNLPAVPKIEIPASYPETLYRSFMKGEMSDAEYHLANAVWVSENSGKYRAKDYTQLPMPVKVYCEKHISGVKPMDRDMLSNIGGWVRTIKKQQEENDSDLSLLNWSKEKCMTVQMGSVVKALDSAIDAFSRAKFPENDYRLANECLKRSTQWVAG